jgi:hypothetical protein
MQQLFLDAHLANGFSAGDFEQNFARFRSIDIHLTKFRANKACNFKLLVNHTIILLNVFGEMAYYGFDVSINDKNKELLTSILVFTQRVPLSAKHSKVFLQALEDNV